MKKILTKSRKTNILYIVSILSTLSFSLALNTSALTYQSDTNIEFAINPTISVSLSGDLIINDLVPGSYSDSNIITVNVATNASHGYYLSATAGTAGGNTNLTHNKNSNYRFTNLTGNKATLASFEDNKWGYAYSTDSGSSWVSGNAENANVGYNGLPLDNDDNGATGVALINTTSPMANNSVQFKIGAKASNAQASGTYTNTINFYAITNQTPLYMQYVSSSTLATLMPNVNDSTILYDIRDNQEYTVAKLADDNYWMAQNLYYDLNTKPSPGGCPDKESGCYYTWENALTICPANWELPTKNDYENLIQIYDTDIKIASPPFSGIYGGYYGEGKFNLVGTHGLYWSSTENANFPSQAYGLRFYSGYIDVESTIKPNSRPVRCLFDN